MIYKTALAAFILSVAYLQQNNDLAASYIASAVQNTKTAIVNDDAAYFERELIEPANNAIDYAAAAAVRKATIFTTLLDDIDFNGLAIPDDAPPMLAIITLEDRGQQTNELGKLSAQYESRGDAGAIGYDKTGGWSYGRYQIATLTGTMGDFMRWSSANYPDYYKALSKSGGARAALNGASSFKSTWVILAKDARFSRAQHEFIADTHYAVLAARLKSAGLDLSKRSHALRDVAWSSAVHHGGKTTVFNTCVKLGSDADIIKCVYAKRATRFTRSTKKVRAAVKSRFAQEQKQALAML